MSTILRKCQESEEMRKHNEHVKAKLIGRLARMEVDQLVFNEYAERLATSLDTEDHMLIKAQIRRMFEAHDSMTVKMADLTQRAKLLK